MKRKALTLFLAYVMLTGCGASSDDRLSSAYIKSSEIPPATVTTTVTASVTAASTASSAPEEQTTVLTKASAETSVITEKQTVSEITSQTTTAVSTSAVPTAAVTSATEQTKQYAEFFGVLIDEDCSDFEDPPRHDTDCMFMEGCRASGYGIDIEQEDGSWVFYMFDDNGQVLAWDYLNTTKRPDGLFVTVAGEWDNGKIKVISIKES